MVRFTFASAAFAAALILSSCARQGTAPAGAAHATVAMRDGTSISGTVLSSSATEVQLAGDDNVTRTIPMTQVRSITYGDPTTPVASTAPAPPGAVPPPAVQDADRVHEQHYHPAESAITSKTFTVPSGAQVTVRTEETIDSSRAAEGQLYAAEVARDVRDSAGDCVIPRGANAKIVIRSASKGGHFHGASDLVMDLAAVSIDGRRYELSTVDLVEKGHDGVGVNKRTGKFAGGGAAVGAIIGAIAGGGKGAAIGAGSGAGAGALGEILTKGTIKVPVESLLTFQLDRPLHIEAR